jgi:hypothetical protein
MVVNVWKLRTFSHNPGLACGLSWCGRNGEEYACLSGAEWETNPSPWLANEIKQMEDGAELTEIIDSCLFRYRKGTQDISPLMNQE